MSLLTKNSKMSKTSNELRTVYNFTLPAVQTCPSAGTCKKNCFATKGAYSWPMVQNKHNQNWFATKEPNFVELMTKEIQVKAKTAKRQNKQLVIRIHDAGDFYSLEYLLKWFHIVLQFPEVQFYCYTKSVSLFKRLNRTPVNLLVNYSFGGLLDGLIDTDTDRHVHIFKDVESLVRAGYTQNDADDSLAFDLNVQRIGLVGRWGMAGTYSANSLEAVS